MLTVVNSVDTNAAILAVLTAKKNPFILSLVAKQGITEVAKFIMERYREREEAEASMYHYFQKVLDYDHDIARKSPERIHHFMMVAEDFFGDCAFSVVVEKMEI